MPFSLGAIELLVLVIMAIPASLLFVRRHRHHRLGIAAITCAALAALVSPADIVSMGLFFVAFAGMFLFGSRYRLEPPATIA